MFNETYIVALTHGVHIYWQSKPYRQKAAVIKEYKRQKELNKDSDAKVQILKAQWVNSELEDD